MMIARSQSGIAPLYWRRADLPFAVGMSLRTIDRLRAKGEWPAPDKIVGSCLLWRPETIERFMSCGGLDHEATMTS
jgi:hypothetical protein